MATKTIKMVFQFRRATAAEWEANKTVVPAAGEPCFVTDQNILKIGDGVTEFGNLEPINGVKIEIAADEKSITMQDNVFKLAGFDAAEIGAQPRKTKDGIEWVVPVDVIEFNALKEAVSGLQTDVTALKSGVKTLQDAIEGKVEPLITKVGTLDKAVEILNGDATVEGSVKKIVADGINEFATEVNENGAIDKFAELVKYVADHEGQALDMVSDIADLQAKVGGETVEAQIKAALEEGNFASAEKVESLQDIVDGISLSYLSEDKANAVFEKVKYEISNTPAGTLVDYREKEIRVMCPVGTEFKTQQVGATGDANMYYMAFKAYAPEGAVGFKEGDQGVIKDEYFDFTGDFAGTDEFGRNYSICWFALASYKNGEWTYFGKNSSTSRYIGWTYCVEWYDAKGVVIASDKIRINLSNEACHDELAPSYMADSINKINSVALGGTVLEIVDKQVNIPVGAGLKGSDEIEIAEDGSLRIKAMSWDKLISGDDEIVMDGGSAV